MRNKLWGLLAMGVCVTGVSLHAQSVEDYLYVPVVSHLTVSQDRYFATSFTSVNLTDATIQGTIEVLNADGSGIPSLLHPCGIMGMPTDTIGPLTYSIAPRNQAETPMTVGTTTSPQTVNGWARVRFDRLQDVQVLAEVALVKGQRMGCDPLYGHSSDEILDILALPAVRATTGSRIKVILSSSRRTALSILNPSESEVAHVEVQLHHETDSAGSTILDIPTLNRISRFVLEILVPEGLTTEGPGPEDPAWLGSATVTSNIPVAIGSLDVVLPEFKLIYVPVESPAVP